MARWTRAAVTVAVAALLFLPVALDRDSLPLSTYPMYSSARSTTSTLVTAQLVVGDERRSLSLDIIGNSDDPLIVTGELRAAIRGGEAARRCPAIAERAVAQGAASPGRGRIEIVSERHETIEFVADRPSLVERTVHESCPVDS